jgi:hypothetical protein
MPSAIASRVLLYFMNRSNVRQVTEQCLVRALQEQYRASFVECLRSEVTKAFQEQELVEMLDTRIK